MSWKVNTLGGKENHSWILEVSCVVEGYHGEISFGYSGTKKIVLYRKAQIRSKREYDSLMDKFERVGYDMSGYLNRNHLEGV